MRRLVMRFLAWVNRVLYIVETDPAKNAEYDRIDRDLDAKGR